MRNPDDRKLICVPLDRIPSMSKITGSQIRSGNSFPEGKRTSVSAVAERLESGAQYFSCAMPAQDLSTKAPAALRCQAPQLNTIGGGLGLLLDLSGRI